MSEHTHEHASPPETLTAAFAVATVLNILLVIAQIGYGVMAHSMALLADAGHNFGDVIGLLLAWGAITLSKRIPTTRFTYGFHSSSIIAALLNGSLLLIVTGAISWEALHRLFEPTPVVGGTVIVVAAIAILINGFAAWLLSGKGKDLNVRGAFLHLLSDALVSFGVLIGGAIILVTGWYWVDPLVSLIVSALIIWSTWGLWREALNMTLAAVPESIDAKSVRKYLEQLEGVEGVHDLHIWPISTTRVALTCHLTTPKGHFTNVMMNRVTEELHHTYHIHHVTIQCESGDDGCVLEPDSVV